MRVIRRAYHPDYEYTQQLLCLLYTNELMDADPNNINLYIYALSLRMSLGVNPYNIIVQVGNNIPQYCVSYSLIRQMTLILDSNFTDTDSDIGLMYYVRTPDMMILLTKYKQPATVENLLYAVSRRWTSVVKELVLHNNYSIQSKQHVCEIIGVVCPVMKELLL